MNILILTDGIYPFTIGGMQKHSYNLVKQLASFKDLKITLVHCVSSTEEIPNEQKVKTEILGEICADNQLSVQTYQFPVPGKVPGHYVRNSLKYSSRVFEDFKPYLKDFDLIYAKGFSAWRFIKEKQKGMQTPPIAVKFHGYEMFQTAPNLKVKLEHLMLRKVVKFNNLYSDYIFSYGSKITEIIRSLGIKEKQIIEIPSGIDKNWIAQPKKASSEVRKFLFIGRYERRKGIEELSTAIQNIPNDLLENIEFHFIGPIPPVKQLKHAQLTYHGKVMDAEKMISLIDNCDIALAPSHSEGMPNVIMEAMARGLAIIATDVGAVGTIVGADNGWLIEPKNVDELTKTLVKAIKIDVQNLSELQAKSIQKITAISWDKIGKRYVEIFNEIISLDTHRM